MGARPFSSPIPRVKSCGFLLFRDGPPKSFLLMRLPGRYDLPKGHLEGRETELQCALRELREETGIRADNVDMDPDFRYTETYFPRYRRFGGRRVEKTLVIFLARLRREVTTIRLSEHDSWEWVAWPPRRSLQRLTVDPLLASVAAHWRVSEAPAADPVEPTEPPDSGEKPGELRHPQRVVVGLALQHLDPRQHRPEPRPQPRQRHPLAVRVQRAHHRHPRPRRLQHVVVPQLAGQK